MDRIDRMDPRTGSVWRPSRLTTEQREERRLAAARMFEQGDLTQAEIARRLGVTPGAVSQWYQAWREQGYSALAARAGRGRRSRLKDEEWAEVADMLQAGPEAAGLEAEEWTLERIAEAIEGRFGVEYHPNYLQRPLRKLGFGVRHRSTWVRADG